MTKRKEKKKWKMILKIILYSMAIVLLFSISIVLLMNVRVILSTKNRIVSESEATKLKEIDCIIVLGAGVKPDKTPSLMLEDRLIESIALYELGVSDCILMSGDHGSVYYDEVNCMKNYAMEKGIPSKAIYMDHAGFCTYDTMYRAKHIFGASKVLIVTQDYHMYRALYDAKQLGLDAYGVVANKRTYTGQSKRDFREILARVKDCYICIKKPEAEIMGDPIPLDGDGDITNDE